MTEKKSRSPRQPRPPMDLETARRASAVVPPIMRFGAVVVLVQCLAMFVYAGSLLVAQVRGVQDSSLESDSAATHFVPLGTAVFLLIIFGFVAFVAVRTLQGRPRSTGAIVLIQAILIGVAFYMVTGGAVALGIVTGISAALVLFTVFHPQTAQYNEARYELRKAER